MSTGASYWGTQGSEYPWTIGWQPDYIAEGRIYGLHIKANHNGKKIAVLYQNDDYGKDYLLGVRAALGKTYADANVVAQEPFEVTATSVASQMTRIRASGATIFVLLATPTPTIRAYATGKALGFNPEQIYLNSVSATAAFLNIAVGAAGAPYVNGSLSVAYLKDPASPQWTNDAAMKQYRQIMAKYAPSADARMAWPSTTTAWRRPRRSKVSRPQGTARPGRVSRRRSTRWTTSTGSASPGVRQKTSVVTASSSARCS